LALKSSLGQNLRRSRLGEHPKNFGPILISPILAILNLVHNLGLGSSLPRNKTFRTKIGRVLASAASKKLLDTYLFPQRWN